MPMLMKLVHRLYQDFYMPSRLAVYGDFLFSAIDRGYEVCSIPHFWRLTERGRIQPIDKLLILRHDIDTDIETTRAMWRVERELGIKSSYFFRLSTVDLPLMREIEVCGGSVGYHFEEVATVAKRKGLKTREQVMEELPYMRDLFERNLTKLRDQTQLPLRFVAAHGDFVNRRLGVPNWVILRDAAFRDRMNIELEAYDEACMRYVQSRHSDDQYPTYWKPAPP